MSVSPGATTTNPRWRRRRYGRRRSRRPRGAARADSAGRTRSGAGPSAIAGALRVATGTRMRIAATRRWASSRHRPADRCGELHATPGGATSGAELGELGADLDDEHDGEAQPHQPGEPRGTSPTTMATSSRISMRLRPGHGFPTRVTTRRARRRPRWPSVPAHPRRQRSAAHGPTAAVMLCSGVELDDVDTEPAARQDQVIDRGYHADDDRLAVHADRARLPGRPARRWPDRRRARRRARCRRAPARSAGWRHALRGRRRRVAAGLQLAAPVEYEAGGHQRPAP